MKEKTKKSYKVPMKETMVTKGLYSLTILSVGLFLSGCSGGGGSLPYSPYSTGTLNSSIKQIAEQQANKSGLPAKLVKAVIVVESGGNDSAVSKTGAQGLMQLMPGTALEYGVLNTFNDRENIRGGCSYLKDLLARYHGNIKLALAAYNAGPKAVDYYHGIPPFQETQDYVRKINQIYPV